jgi:putative SOS response-associated peptidase YedK
VAPIHNRQPAVLEPAQLGSWLTGASDADGLAVLEGSAPGTLAARAVSSRVNSVANDDAACLAETPVVQEWPRQRPRQLSLLDDD